MYRSSNLIDERKCFMVTSQKRFLTHTLYDAVVDCDLNTIKYLLEVKKVEPNKVLEEYDAAALHMAAGIGTEDLSVLLMEILLSNGADPNIQTSDGTTPLMIAGIYGRPKVFKLLLSFGGNPLLKDIDGMKAVDYAIQNGFHFMNNILEGYSGDNSFLMSSDITFCNEENMADVTQKFLTFFNDDSFVTKVKSNKITTDPIPFSDIESEKHFVEICDLDTGFLRLSDQEVSSSESFRSLFKDNSSHCVKENLVNNKSFEHDHPFCSDDSVHKEHKIMQENIAEYSSSFESCKSSATQLSTVSYRTDRIKMELKRHNINHGPVTASTKRVYYNLIRKLIRGKSKGPLDIDEFSNFPEVLRTTLKGEKIGLNQNWLNFETLLSKNFSDSTKVWRGGKEKQFFTYLLLDPFITANLPESAENMTELQIWKTFLLSVFYIGKGKNSRPFSHLYEALKSNFKKTISKKVQRIQSIWENSSGIICLHIFHNVICAEAHTREAAMIDALGLYNLTNIQSGEYYGIVKNWSSKQKQQLGVVLLYKALQIYLAEGERQIFPCDLK